METKSSAKTWNGHHYGDIFYDTQGNTLQVQKNLDTGELFAAVIQQAAMPIKLATGTSMPKINGRHIIVSGHW
jgi:hypothetical protein